MTRYVNKDSVIAELIRRLSLLENGTANPDVIARVEGVVKGYKSILDFLDTLEVKEMKEEKIRKEIYTYLFNELNNTKPLTPRTNEFERWLKWLKYDEQKSDIIVEKAKIEKQRVLLTETNGNAGIDWDTRSLADTKMLLEYGLDFINKKFEKQGEQKPTNYADEDVVEKHSWKDGDIVRLKDDNGKRWQLSKSSEPEEYEEWFISEIRENGIAGGWVSTYILDTDYVFVENPLDEAALLVEKEFEKVKSAVRERKEETSWSEEDDSTLGYLLAVLEDGIPTDSGKMEKIVDWLRTLKQRIGG